MFEESIKNSHASLPVVPIRDVAVFPFMVAPLVLTREASISALDDALKKDQNNVVLVAQKDPLKEKPLADDLYLYGVLSKVIQVLKFPDGTVKIIVEGVSRVHIQEYEPIDSNLYARTHDVVEQVHLDSSTKALVRITIEKFEDYMRRSSRYLGENIFSLGGLINEPGRLADIIATYLEISTEEKERVLETSDTTKRLELMSETLEREIELLGIEEMINDKLRTNLNKTQKEIYLREKLKAIKDELKGEDEAENEAEEYKIKVNTLDIPEKYKNRLLKEISRLEKMPAYSMEISFSKNYLERVLDLPWNTATKDIIDIKRARKILDEDHWGLKDVKDRIIEFLAVKQLTKKKQATILCFAGPPGVGKTSLAKSIARSMDRKFSYISLGGINDESEIRGHRRTYVGSMPGRIIQAIENAGTKNPVILLDELEKMMRSHMGDPTAALLEVLDPEQNVNFTDHYIDIPFDLSEVFFIATANSLDSVYKALRDRLEVIQLSGYTEEEKTNIAKLFLIPKQLELHGIKKSQLSIKDSALKSIINEYTKEAGVRNLERSIARLCRKIATEIVQDKIKKSVITSKNITKYLGSPKYTEEEKRKKDEVGVVNGLAWTETGGEVLYIEANIMPGKGKLNLTGSLGDIMKESAQAAYSFIRSNYKKYNLPADIQEKSDIHVHIPEGAIPKDGPSAGLAITMAILSALTEKKARADIALTGEVTLRGKVLRIGGLKEKVLAGVRNDIFNIIVPLSNKKDALELPDYIKEKVNFIYVDNAEDAIKQVFS